MRVWQRNNHSVQVEVVDDGDMTYVVRADEDQETWVVMKRDYEPIPAYYVGVPPSQTYSEGPPEPAEA